MRRFTFKDLFVGSFVVLVLLSLTTCGESAGLGSTVDTVPPKLTIEYPPAAAAIRGTFVFAGTCSDDKGIARIEVKVKNLDTGEDYGTSLAAVDNSLTWKISINKYGESGFELPDGKYQLEAIAYDKSGRSSDWIPRQFDIDNTPPVFVITKPGVVRSTNLENGARSKYGSLFSVEGTIADDHSIENMDVAVYDKDGNPVSSEPYSEQEISTTGGTVVTIARYLEDGQEIPNQRYNEIYSIGEADEKGNKTYSCTVTVADSTKEYIEPGDSGVGPGNITSTVYLYDEVYDDFMSATKGAGLSASDFMTVLNGTASDEKLSGKGIISMSVAEVKEALAKFAKDSSNIEENSLSFSINPDGDPTYLISGFTMNYNAAGTSLSANTNKATAEQPLTIIVSEGLNQVKIVPSSIKVWIRRISGAGMKALTKSDLTSDIQKLVVSVKSLELESASFGNGKEVGEWLCIYDNSASTDPSDSTVSISTELPGNNYIDGSSYYAIAVTGHDKDDSYLSQTKLHGFVGTISAVAPSLVIDKTDDYMATSKYTAGSEREKLIFTGTAKENNAGMLLRELEAKVTVTNEVTNTLVGEISAKLEWDEENYRWTSAPGFTCVYDDSASVNKNFWTFIPSECAGYSSIACENEGLMYLYTLEVTATGTAELTAKDSKNIHIDTTKPELIITSVTPSVLGSEYFDDNDTNIYINGDISIKGSIDEQNLVEVTYDVWASTDLSKGLTASDSILSGLKNYVAEKNLDVDIDGSMGKIYQITKTFPTSLITSYFIDKIEGVTEDVPIQVEVVVTAVDKVDNKTVYKSSEYNEGGKNFVIYQETNRPKITLGNADKSVDTEDKITESTNLFGVQSNNTLQISVTDDDSIVDYEIYVWKQGENKPSSPNHVYTPGKSSASVNYKLPPTEGIYNVQIVARDFLRSDTNTDENNLTGKSDSGIFKVAVSSGAPNVAITSPSNDTWVTVGTPISFTAQLSKDSEVTVTGFVYDKTGNKICSAEKNNLTTGTPEALPNGTDSEYKYQVTGTFTLPAEAQGRYKLEVKASDRYSQFTNPTVTVGVDSTKPVWDSDSIRVNKKEYSYVEGSSTHDWYNVSSMSFSGELVESADGSGIDSIYYKLIKAGEADVVPATKADFSEENSFVATRIKTESNDGVITNTDREKFNTTLGEFTVKNDASGNAQPNIVYLMAVDNAGNESDVQKFYIYIDAEAPSFESSVTGTQYSNKTLAIPVSGTASDDASGVASVKLSITLDGSSTPLVISGTSTEIAATSTDSFANWSAEIPASFLAKLNNTIYAVKATVTDKAGNKASSTIFRIDVDGEKPEIENLSISDAGGTYSTDKQTKTIDGVAKEVYYAHRGNKFTISGSVQDDKSGIKTIVINDGTTDIITKRDGKDITSLPISDINLSSYTAVDHVELTVKATDNAGNEIPSKIYVIFDDTPPEPLHAIDEKGKDLFFRIGEYDNDKDEIAAASLTFSDSFDKDVGGKYANGTYGNKKTMKIRGTMADTGSGVDMIYYKVVSETELTTTSGYSSSNPQATLKKIAEKFKANYSEEKTGYFAPGMLDTEKNRRVFYTGALKNAAEETTSLSTTSGEYKDYVSALGSLSGSTKSYATIESNYSSVLSGFEVGKNYLMLLVIDKVGNKALDSVKISGETFSNFSLNVDQTLPSANVAESSKGIKYINNTKTGEFIVEGTASDADAGLAEIIISQGSKEIVVKEDSTDGKTENENGKLEITKTDGNKAWTWKATLKNNKFFAGASGTVSVALEAKDSAGNIQNINAATVVIDTALKSVELKAPSDADTEDTENAKIQINGTITLEGTVDDENVLPGTAIQRIEYKTGSGSWTDLSNVSGMNLTPSGNYTFKVEGFNTTLLSDGDYKLRAVGVDSAGNEKNSSEIDVTISQDSDRPKVKISNLSKNGSSYILMYGTEAQITGTVIDDDSTASDVVKEFWMTENPATVEKNTDGSLKKNADGTYSVIETLSDNSTRAAVNKIASGKWNKSTGEFTFAPTDKEDGRKTFYILVVDNKDKIFYTKAEKAGTTAGTTVPDTLLLPKVYVKGEACGDTVNAAVFSYNSDGTNPAVTLTEGLPYGTTASGTKESAVAKDDVNENFALSTAEKATKNATLNASFKVGGVNRRFVEFHFNANDASGVEGMSVEFKDENKVSLLKLATSAAIITKAKLTGYTVSGSFTDSDDGSSDAKWTTAAIDLSTLGAIYGQITVSVTPYDKAGLSGNGACNFYIDNAAPKIEKIEPKSGSEVSGDVEISGSSDDVGVVGTANIQWIVPSTTVVTAYNGKSDSEKITYLKGLEWNGGKDKIASGSGVSQWKFIFDGNSNDKLDVYDNATYAGTNITADGIYTLPIWFKATDALGNTSFETGYEYKHNPDADKPKLEFSYPTKENYKSATDQYAVLGGTIRASGSAIIPSGQTTVNSVYFQIAHASTLASAGFTGTAAADTSGTDSYKAKNTYEFKVVSAYDVINKIRGTSYTSASSLTDDQVKPFGFKTKAELDAWWGIEATGTASWNFKLNENKKMNPTSGTNDIVIRACGVNAEAKFGSWTSGDNMIAIRIDNTAPVITAAVNKYNEGTDKITKVPNLTAATDNDVLTSSLPYDSDMYLKGYWTLVATLLDEVGLNTTTPYNVFAGENETQLVKGTGYYVEEDVTEDSKHGVRLYIPIPKDSSGSVKLKIEANDTDHTASQTFSFKIDETAPTLDSLSGNGTLFDETDPAKLFTSIEDSNYRFTIAGSSSDSVSGVKNIVFYYIRENGVTGTITNEVVMDPFVWTETTKNKVKMNKDDLMKLELKQDADNTYSLYAKAYSGSATTDKFTSTSDYDAHVRVGGLVQIDGVLRTISKIEGKVVTFTPSLSSAKKSVIAAFPIAQVIDNSAVEKVSSYSGDSFAFEKGDDGDGMPESFSKGSGKTWTWDAAIRSNNMPDGPVSIVILAFDNAGNVAGRTINTKITNNAPRIAKVFLGTDLNGDGNYTNSNSIEELVEYDILGAEGTEQSAYELDFTATTTVKNDATPKFKNGVFTIKNGLAVVPEFVGGNGNIGMVLNNAASSKAVVTKGTASTTWYAKTSAGSVVATTDSENNAVATASKSFTGTVAGTLKGTNANYKMYSYVVAKNDVGSDAASKGMSFTFWDSTEETTQGTSSQNAVLYVKNFKVAQSDSTPPTVVVNPFYWEGEGEGKNSLYGGSKANGHVELEADWTALASDNTTPLTGWDKKGVKGGTYLDSDPKVSGKIRFTGTAYDNYRLGSISFSFGDFKTDQLVAEYKKVGDVMKWDITSSTIGDGYVFAVNDTTLDEDGNKVYHGHYRDSAYFGQAGHKVYWTLDIDTEKISTAADKDVSLTVTAKDAANKTTSTTTISAPTVTNGKRTVTDGTTNFPVYVVDVVPYITGIENKVGDAYKKDSSVFGRSATGSYPVYYYNETNRETFTVKGFNFGSSPSISVNGGTATSGTSVTVTSAMTSGGVVVTVGSGTNAVSSLNNVNNNNAKGSYDAESESGYNKYKNYYNRQPNNVNNSTLTDDCKVAVWNVKQVVTDKAVRYPTMRVGKDTNETIAFVYDSSSDAVKAYKSTTNATKTPFELGSSFTQWYDTAVAVDSNGNLYGSGMNGDTGSGDGNARYNGNNANNLFFAKNTSSNQSTWAYSSSSYGIAIESGKYNGQFYSTRVTNPKIATDKNNALYMVYYDSGAQQVRFRYGSTSGQDGFKSHGGSQTSATPYHVIAGAKDVLNYSAVKTANTSRAGEYVAVGATNETTPAAIVVWYSESDQGLYYTYNTTPSNQNGWTDAVLIDDDFVGWYVDLVVDGANGVHIAYYDASNGDLKYAYIEDYTKPNEAKTMTVDSYLSSGTNISISVKKVGSDYVPYISSFMSSFNKTSYTVRTAWITDGSLLKTKTADELKGVDVNDDFTGVWEVMTVPLASSSIPLDYSVGIGIKSSQPILGYGTQNGLETATLK